MKKKARHIHSGLRLGWDQEPSDSELHTKSASGGEDISMPGVFPTHAGSRSHSTVSISSGRISAPLTESGPSGAESDHEIGGISDDAGEKAERKGLLENSKGASYRNPGSSATVASSKVCLVIKDDKLAY